MSIIINLLKIVHIILCILVVFGVLMMHQKSEGLAGVMGQSSYSSRGIKGMDEGMRKMITYLGIGLLCSSILLGILGY
jgi:protein translocase SecG subunit